MALNKPTFGQIDSEKSDIYSFSTSRLSQARIKRLETAIPRQSGGNFRSSGKVLAVKRDTWGRVLKALNLSD